MSSSTRFNVAFVFFLVAAIFTWWGAGFIDPDVIDFDDEEIIPSSAELFEQQRSQGPPVAWTLYSTNQSLIYPLQGYAAETMHPLRPLHQGNIIEIPEGEEVSVFIPSNMSRRHFRGPATLSVIKDTVSLSVGAPPRVFPAQPERLALIRQWAEEHPRRPPYLDMSKLQLLQPREGSVFLRQSPLFRFFGKLPRDAQLIVFNEEGRRFWVAPVETLEVRFPPAAKFEWGKKYTWELRRSTGGRVLSGQFEIASEPLVSELLNSHVALSSKLSREELLFYGMSLDKARAYPRAEMVWKRLGASPYPPQ